MEQNTQHPAPVRSPLISVAALKRLGSSISTKIVLPYLLLTLAVAGVGAFVVVRLVTASLQERFNNQLLDAGRVVSESMVDFEAERLEVLRAVIGTEGVAQSLAAGNRAGLAERVPQLVANSTVDAVELLDLQGREVFGWQRPPNRTGFKGEERTGADFSHLQEVKLVLEGFTDEFGEKRVLLAETPYGLMIFTAGPVYYQDRQVGAALVGTYIREMLVSLTESAVARVTLYDPQGRVLDTTLGGGQGGITEILQESPEQYDTVRQLLRESPNRHPVVVARAKEEVPLRQVQVLGQEYTLAYGDWRLRGQSFGLFSVALPSNFIVSTAATSRNLLSLIFSLATIGVFALGFAVAQRIIRPLNRLVQTSVAVAQGDLARRTGIRRSDEIGSLAQSFDIMTDRLVQRNRQLVEQASRLEAILNSIVDGVLVLDPQGLVITSNPAAQQILAEVSSDILANILRELPAASETGAGSNIEHALEIARLRQPRRYHIGNRVLSALIAPVKLPDGEELGTVVALRDITREAEADRLKDGFIKNISHELRTPLTAVKGYSDLLLMTSGDGMDPQQLEFVQSISSNTSKLLHHINEIIDISEIQAGSLMLNKTEVCFSELVEEGIAAWKKQMEGKGLYFRYNPASDDLWVHGDPDRLSWALDNLLNNACNYTLTGGVEVRVFRENDQARLDIIDTGVGVAVDDQAYLFTAFFRASHPATFNVAGVGLGLFITRALIEAHGGRVWAVSELDCGSTFSLALPVLREHPAANIAGLKEGIAQENESP